MIYMYLRGLNTTHEIHNWGSGRCGERWGKRDFTLSLPMNGAIDSYEVTGNGRGVLELESDSLWMNHAERPSTRFNFSSERVQGRAANINGNQSHETGQ